MSEKRATVIVPVYNAGDGIYRCINSLLHQNSDAFQVLLINDGSTDNSLEIITRIANDHPDIFKVIDQNNAGVCETRHRGIAESDTEYILFMDNDDYVEPDYIKRLVHEADTSGADIVICGCRRVSEKGVKFVVRPTRQDEFAPYLMTAPWARIFRRQLLIDHDVRFLECSIGEDAYFNLSAYLYTDAIKTIDYVGYNWYYNEESVSNTLQRGLNNECDPLQLLSAISLKYDACGCRNAVFDYFVYRYVVWYLLWSGKTASPERFMEEYRRLFQWLDNHHYSLNIKFYDARIASDKLQNRLAISIFSKLSFLHLVGIFAKLYCANS